VPEPLSDQREPVNILYYSDGGMGKTSHLAALANLGKVLAFNAEQGIKAGPLKKLGVKTENIEVFPGPGEELSYEGIEEQWLRVREELAEDPDAYAGVFWDSATEIQQAMKDRSVKGSIERANRAGRDRSAFVVDQDNWRETNEQCRSLIRKFRDLPCHFGLSALERREQDDDGAVVYYPSVTPSLLSDLVGWVDIVCHCSISIVDDEEEFRGLFRPHGKYRGKDRFKILPKWLVTPTFDRVIEYVNGDLTIEDDQIMQEARDRAKTASQDKKKAEK
jgi:hypothetical protein